MKLLIFVCVYIRWQLLFLCYQEGGAVFLLVWCRRNLVPPLVGGGRLITVHAQLCLALPTQGWKIPLGSYRTWQKKKKKCCHNSFFKSKDQFMKISSSLSEIHPRWYGGASSKGRNERRMRPTGKSLPLRGKEYHCCEINEAWVCF